MATMTVIVEIRPLKAFNVWFAVIAPSAIRNW